jgi:alcohol dehydrogenase
MLKNSSAFYMPARVFAEKNAVKNHARELCGLGTRALIVTGRHSALANGSYQDVTDVLDSAGIGHVLFNEVEENPSTHTIMKARDLGVSEKVDFVIGIGGGSPMDAAKAIALMIRKADKDISYLYKPDGDSLTLPVAAVPTTCGTGSEVTGVSVLTDPDRQIKKSIPHKIFPDLALVDGSYLKFASGKILANTAFDALTHLVESYLNSKANDFSRMCVDAGLRAWAKSLDILKGEREPGEDDYYSMMLASTLAGMAIAHTGTTLPHGLSYSMTYFLHVPHGKATAYFTAGYLTEAPQKDRDYLLQTAGFSSVQDFQKVYRKACGPIDAEDDKVREVLKKAVLETGTNPAKLSLAPFPVDMDMLERIAYFELNSEE